MPTSSDIDRAIRGKGRTTDRAIADLAERQHGVVARRQLLQMDVSPDAIDRRVARGLLHRVHRGVYAVGHSRLGLRGNWMAAVLGCGPGAVLSHRDAAALWDLVPVPDGKIHVSVPRSVRGPSSIRVHVSRSLDGYTARRKGIPVTSPSRTLVDLASVFDATRLRRVVEEAERVGLLDHSALRRLCMGGRRGLKNLRALLASYDGSAAWKRSDLEGAFLDLCRIAKLPPPQVNPIVCGKEVDAFWPGQRLIVEADSFEHHKTREAFERDRERDMELQLAGHRVLRVTHRRLESDPEAVAQALRRLLARSG
jgi:hypothetical protein